MIDVSILAGFLSRCRAASIHAVSMTAPVLGLLHLFVLACDLSDVSDRGSTRDDRIGAGPGGLRGTLDPGSTAAVSRSVTLVPRVAGDSRFPPPKSNGGAGGGDDSGGGAEGNGGGGGDGITELGLTLAQESGKSKLDESVG